LKGTAGNIGAKGVQAAAAELEHAYLVNSSPEDIDRALERTLSELAPVIVGLQAVGVPVAASPNAAATPATAANTAEIAKGLKRLTALLQDSDSAATEAVDSLIALTRGTPLAQPLLLVSAAVADFDFDAALEHLARGAAI
jgi:HPt (histidine-containing phosphotransfer) domain-containing protein